MIDVRNDGHPVYVGIDGQGLAVWSLEDGSEPSRMTVQDFTGTIFYESPVVTADFDSDGLIDIAFLDPNNQFVIYTLASGQWDILSSHQSAHGNLYLIDLLGDHIPDLVVWGATAEIYQNDGNGQFTLHQTIEGIPQKVFIGNIDTDNLDDFLTASNGSQSYPYLQQTDGSFIEEPVVNNITSFQAADVTGDGIMDIISNDYANDIVQLARGIGDSTFATPETIIQGRFAVILADIDADGDRDICTQNNDDVSSIGLITYFNDGTGNFVEHVDSIPRWVELYDRDVGYRFLTRTDGIVDLLGNGKKGQAIIHGRGDGTFVLPLTTKTSNMQIIRRLSVADLDNDGDPDVVAIGDFFSGGPDGVAIFMNQGNASLEYLTDVHGSNGSRDDVHEAPALEDFDGDGDIDIAFWSGEELIFAENTPDGMFTGRHTLQLQGGTIGSQVLSADFNEDGLPDIITYGDSRLFLSLFINEGAWEFAKHQVPSGVALLPGIADFDGDGHMDILLVQAGSPSMIAVLPGRGDGSFDAPILSDIPSTRPLLWAYTGDFNGDGNLDFLANKYVNSDMSLYTNTGDGHFVFTGTLPRNERNPRRIGVADLNGDGLDDFVAGDQLENLAHMYISHGDGTFTPVEILGTAAPSTGITSSLLADMNSDNNLDIVMAHNAGFGAAIAIYLNSCGGFDCPVDLNTDTFVNTQDFIYYIQLWNDRAHLADWNHDNVVDTSDISAYVNEWTFGCS